MSEMKRPRGGRFEVSGIESAFMGDDFLVLEIRTKELLLLKEQIDLSLELQKKFEAENGIEDGSHLCLLFYGRPHPQRADSADGTSKWPPSYISEEVKGEWFEELRRRGFNPDRWK
jgi:hypothetical protein